MDFWFSVSFFLSLSLTHASRFGRKRHHQPPPIKKQDTWERDGRTMYKIEVYITNKGQVREFGFSLFLFSARGKKVALS